MNLAPRADIVWRDPGLLVLDKASGVPVLADRSGMPCLWEALEALLAPEGLRPLAVHRIDKGTSGLLLVALNRKVQRRISAAFEAGTVDKWYAAIGRAAIGRAAIGRAAPDGAASHSAGLPPGTLTIDLPLAPGRKSRWRVAGPRDAIAFDSTGKRYHLPSDTPLKQGARTAITRARTHRSDGKRSLFSVHLITGRTHQIRVHLAWIGAPLLGDHLYGAPADSDQQASRLALHCRRLRLPSLGDGIARPTCFRAPLPGDFRALLPQLPTLA